jgi:hypothetical protein
MEKILLEQIFVRLAAGEKMPSRLFLLERRTLGSIAHQLVHPCKSEALN